MPCALPGLGFLREMDRGGFLLRWLGHCDLPLLKGHLRPSLPQAREIAGIQGESAGVVSRDATSLW